MILLCFLCGRQNVKAAGVWTEQNGHNFHENALKTSIANEHVSELEAQFKELLNVLLDDFELE